MKKLLCVLAVLTMIVPIAMADKIDLSTMTMNELLDLQTQLEEEINSRQNQTKQTNSKNPVVYQDKNCIITFKGNYVVKSGSTSYSVVEFTYKNIGKTSESADFLVSITQYQNGVELDWGILWDYPTETSTKVRPGASITIRDVAKLRNTTTDVELVVDEWLDLNDSHDDYVMMLKIK